MAAQESLHEYYLHQHRNIEHYLDRCMDHPEAELVHQLRLGFKRLRAFNKLAEQLCIAETDEHIHRKNRVRQLYKIAGQLRDTQVQLHLLVSVEEQMDIAYPEYNKWLLRCEKKKIARFGKKLKHVMPHSISHNAHQKTSKMLAQADDKTILNAADQVLSGLFAKIQELLASNMRDNELHRIRILSKQMRYIISIMQHSYPDYNFRDLSVDALREIDAATGHWHDCLVKVELLGKCIGKLQSSDNSTLSKYKTFLNTCYSGLHIAYIGACLIARRELHSDVHENEVL